MIPEAATIRRSRETLVSCSCFSSTIFIFLPPHSSIVAVLSLWTRAYVIYDCLHKCDLFLKLFICCICTQEHEESCNNQRSGQNSKKE